tara:strand:+ start:155 stop:526 length:372 start_codon:yes stop_codon:yes gene_type:complete
MSFFLLLKHVIKNNDPVHIFSFNDNINYNQIKVLWDEFIRDSKKERQINISFNKIKMLGDLTNDLAYLNIYSKKGESNMFGLYYCNGITKYYNIISNDIKKILDSDKSDDNIFVLTYLIRLKY